MVALLRMPFANKFEEARGAERRVFARKEIQSRVEGRRNDHSISARREPVLSLMLRDLSAGGLSALTHTPLDRGERISVFFPPQGARGGWDAHGRVVRCEASSMGYRVAVEFENMAAA